MRELKKMPQIRFPEFKESWEESLLSDFLTKYSENNSDNEFAIDDILSLSSIHGIVDRKELLEDTYSNVNHLNYKKTRLNDFVYGKSISSSYPFGLFKVNNCKDGLLSTLYFTFKVKDYVNPMFLDLYFSHLTRVNNFLRKYVLVGDRYITADSDYLLSGKIYLPTQIDEQQKIASFLTVIDEKLQALKKKKTLLEQYKKGVMQKLFSQELRFKDENGMEFPDWEEKKLGESLEYEQPTNYLVSSIEYEDRFETPVVTAGKTFILGYTNEINGIFKDNLPVIIFDDFTTATQFVDFPFKAKSSAMKILKAKETVNIKFIYEAMQNIKYETGGHGRHWISVFAELPILIPTLPEQARIANFLSSIDDKINHTHQQIEKTEVWKKGLLQKMFV